MEFIALNGGPEYAFTPAISFSVDCETQAEIDELWAKLSEGGEQVQCGWLNDKFGVSWQIVPSGLGELLGGEDPEKSQRAMKAMFGMVKLDIDALRRAREGVAEPVS
jgi:predicted 3-demethylubiquinone-9 3-methyltransferase (glyoxalase superfamily)